MNAGLLDLGPDDIGEIVVVVSLPGQSHSEVARLNVVREAGTGEHLSAVADAVSARAAADARELVRAGLLGWYRLTTPARTSGRGEEPYHREKDYLYVEGGGKCHYCGAALRFAEAEIDHKVARSKGGTDARENLVVACSKCNKAKGSLDYHAFMAARR